MDFRHKNQVISSSPEETMQIGAKIGADLDPGAIVALKGPLGSGKTVLARGIAASLGVVEQISSPTYTIICEYEGNIPFYHIDAYRLSGDEDFRLSGGEELLYGAGICVIEWADRLTLPSAAIYMSIIILEDGKRCISWEKNSEPNSF